MRTPNIIFATLFLFATAAVASAQSGIVNIPSTDVVERSHFYLEANYGAHFASYSNGGFQAYGVKTMYGLHRNVEVGANFSFVRAAGTSAVGMTPNVKWQAYSNEKH